MPLYLGIYIAGIALVFITGCSSSSNNSRANGAPQRNATSLSVGYFNEWPTPNLVAKSEKMYDERLGFELNWLEFDTGVEMVAAMRSGQVDLAYSPGIFPVVHGINNGAAILTVAVAVEYPTNPCIVRNGTGITASNATELEGKTVAVPLKTGAEYSFRRQMSALGVNPSLVIVQDFSVADASDALVNGAVDMACVFGSENISKALLSGTELMSDAQMIENGIINFDVVLVSDTYAQSFPVTVKEFLKVTEEYNQKYTASQPELDLIVNESGLDQAAVVEMQSTMRFSASAIQKSTYMNAAGLVAKAYAVAGEIYVSNDGNFLTDYSATINASFLP